MTDVSLVLLAVLLPFLVLWYEFSRFGVMRPVTVDAVYFVYALVSCLLTTFCYLEGRIGLVIAAVFYLSSVTYPFWRLVNRHRRRAS